MNSVFKNKETSKHLNSKSRKWLNGWVRNKVCTVRLRKSDPLNDSGEMIAQTGIEVRETETFTNYLSSQSSGSQPS